MTFLPLNLGVRLKSDTERGASPSSRPLAKSQTEKILKRDDYTCRFCGFRSEKYQRVVACDAAGADPFVTCCTFCEHCLTLDRVGMMGAAILIWLPEIAQAELNHMARAIYVARSGAGEIATLATRASDALVARRAEAKKRLGSDDPLMLATILHEALTPAEIKTAMDKLDGIRLLALDKHIVRTAKGDTNQFSQMVNYWVSSQGPYGQIPPEQWGEKLEAVLAQAGNA